MNTLKLTNLVILAIQQEIADAIDIDSPAKDFALRECKKTKI